MPLAWRQGWKRIPRSRQPSEWAGTKRGVVACEEYERTARRQAIRREKTAGDCEAEPPKQKKEKWHNKLIFNLLYHHSRLMYDKYLKKIVRLRG